MTQGPIHLGYHKPRPQGGLLCPCCGERAITVYERLTRVHPGKDVLCDRCGRWLTIEKKHSLVAALPIAFAISFPAFFVVGELLPRDYFWYAFAVMFVAAIASSIALHLRWVRLVPSKRENQRP